MVDVSLEQYAAVQAAVADAFPLQEALAVESIGEAAWKAAHREWAERLVDDQATFASYTAEMQRAEDRLRREVFPLESEPRAWAAFLLAYGARSPQEMSAETGLGLPDVSRLTRHWQKRCWEDVTIVDRLREHRHEVEALPDAKVAIPAIRLGARTLRGTKERPPRPTLDGVPPDSGIGPRMPVDGYAALVAELSKWPKEEERILAKHRISRIELSAIETDWEARFERDPSLRVDFRRLLAHQRNRLAARFEPLAEPQPQPPPSRRSRRRTVAEELSRTMRSSSTELAAAKLGGAKTILAEGKHRPATADVQAAARAPSLPFADGPPVKIPRRFVPQAPGARGKTADVVAQASARPQTLPFAVPRPRKKPTPRTEDVSVASSAPTLPFEARSPQAPRDPQGSFTIEHYASLCTELGLWPNLAPEILTRYGLTATTKAALDVELKAKMATDRALYQRWYAASEKYLAWLLTNTPPGS